MMGDKPAITRSAPFFSATEDPIFDTSILDPKTGKATLLSYSGLVTPVTLGAAIRDRVRRLVAAAGRLSCARCTYTPMDANWMPGGRQPIAVHLRLGAHLSC